MLYYFDDNESFFLFIVYITIHKDKISRKNGGFFGKWQKRCFFGEFSL